MTAPRRSYSPDCIERALDHHLRGGRITFWQRHGSQYLIGLNRHEDLQLRSHREAWILVTGLASADRAPLPEPEFVEDPPGHFEIRHYTPVWAEGCGAKNTHGGHPWDQGRLYCHGREMNA